jgi:hypothetical protein
MMMSIFETQIIIAGIFKEEKVDVQYWKSVIVNLLF